MDAYLAPLLFALFARSDGFHSSSAGASRADFASRYACTAPPSPDAFAMMMSATRSGVDASYYPSAAPTFNSMTMSATVLDECGGADTNSFSATALMTQPPRPAESYLQALTNALQSKADSAIKESCKRVFDHELASYGGHKSASPSLFLNTARALAKMGKPDQAIKIATNCLESGIDNVQMLQSVGYVLLSTSTAKGLDLAISVFDKIKELAPSEPQSYMDSSLACFQKSWNIFQSCTSGNKVGLGPVGIDGRNTLFSIMTSLQADLVHVLTHRWARQFEEVEWPVLILLHYVKELAEAINNTSLLSALPVWPLDALSCFNEVSSNDPMQVKSSSGTDKTDSLPLFCAKFDAVLMVWLGWDTDQTDVDLHVQEPSGKEVYYGNKRGTASLLSCNFTQGYGPEVYLVKQDGALVAGDYQVYAKYYGLHQDSVWTGNTSAVVWTIAKVPPTTTTTTAAGGFAKGLKFDFVRLDTHKQMTHVSTATVPM
ncbi:hypothetical protein ACA910_018959 [Epithemia clementina (nom. ined.)]